MSCETVKKYLAERGFCGDIIEFEADTATVAQAAQTVGCEEKMIAKTLSFELSDGIILIVMSGDAKVDNKLYREEFGEKAKMIPFDEVEAKTGHAPGGVCPFATANGVRVYADTSLQRFKYFYPAAGNAHSAVKMTADGLFKYGNAVKWVSVGKKRSEE